MFRFYYDTYMPWPVSLPMIPATVRGRGHGSVRRERAGIFRVPLLDKVAWAYP
jgi:hypothetical protein